MYKGLDYIGQPDPFSSISNLIELSEKMLDQTTLESDTDLIKCLISKHEDDDNSDSVWEMEKSGEPKSYIFTCLKIKNYNILKKKNCFVTFRVSFPLSSVNTSLKLQHLLP